MIVITKRDVCIYATIKGAETIKATQIRLFGVKIVQVHSYAPKLYSYMRKCRLKYLEHVLKKRNGHNNGAECQQSSWQSRWHEDIFFYVCIEQCTGVQTAKTENMRENTPHRTRTCRSCMYVQSSELCG